MIPARNASRYRKIPASAFFFAFIPRASTVSYAQGTVARGYLRGAAEDCGSDLPSIRFRVAFCTCALTEAGDSRTRARPPG